MIEELLKEIESLKKAKDLLESVYFECGPYSNKLSDDLQNKINDYFGFNDDE